jgi:hypothetical protein
MIKNLIYRLLNIKKPKPLTKMKWVWYNIHIRDDEDNKFVDIRSKM